jgi:hypothetical protein
MNSKRRGRRKGGGKRAICGREPEVAIPGARFPSDAEWQVLQDKLEHRLDDSLRWCINNSSVYYWLGAPQSHSLIRVSAASNSIEKWQRKTSVLRKIIWKQPIKRSAPSSLYDVDGLDRFLKWSDIEQLRDDPLSLLAAILDSAIVVSDLVIAEINDSDTDINEALNWYLWVSHLIFVLRDHKVLVAKQPSKIHTKRSGKRYGVPLFIAELEKTYMPVYRRRKTVESIQKGIRDAMRVTRDISFYVVGILLTRWMLGESDFFGAPLARKNEVRQSLYKIRARMRTLKERRTRNQINEKKRIAVPAARNDWE